MEERDVATAFLRYGGDLLASRRADDAESWPGRWAVICGDVAEDEAPEAAARRAVREQVGRDRPTLVRTGTSLSVDVAEHSSDDATEHPPGATAEHTSNDALEIYPVLFDVSETAVDLGTEFATHEWLPATELLRRETVPELWTAYRRVAPTVQSVVADDEHGAATLSIRALEVLRDRAGLLVAEGESDREELDALGRRLRRARPSMAVLRNRVNRALAASSDDPADVERAAIEGIANARRADAEAAMRAAGVTAGDRVLTLSRSGTVLDALRADEVAAVFVAESRPAGEGTAVAEALAADLDATVSLHTDAAVAHVLASEPADAVLVGADAILPDGRVVNKTGTRGAAIAAAREGLPVYVAAASDKVTTREDVNLESGDATAVYDGDAPLDVRNPTFDVTPADAITGFVTERGVLDPDDVGEIAAELRALEPD